MHQVSFDPSEMKGKIITNTSYVKKEHLDETLSVFYDAIHSGLAVSPMIEVLEEERSIKIKTAAALPFVAFSSSMAYRCIPKEVA